MPQQPEKPFVARSGVHAFEVSWKASNLNGAPLVGYKLQMKHANLPEPVVLFEGVQTIVTVPNLTGGIGYQFRVCCVNEVGESLFSEYCTPIEVGDYPDRLKPPSITQKSKSSVMISWHAPARMHGAELQCYTLQYKNDTALAWQDLYKGIETEYGLENVDVGSSYMYRVSCTNEYGQGAFSEEASLQIAHVFVHTKDMDTNGYLYEIHCIFTFFLGIGSAPIRALSRFPTLLTIIT